MSFPNWAKFLYRGVRVIINNIEHNSKRARVEPLPITRQTKSNYFGSSRCTVAVAAFCVEGAAASISDVLSRAGEFKTQGVN